MRCYLVGGAVRDELLGLAPGDRDWLVVGETAQSMRERGFRPVGQHFTTFLHPHSGEEYSLPRGATTAIGERACVRADLAARDLTVNAMARAPSGSLIDPFGGREDLTAGVLRHVSSHFDDDPLRVLRVVRFSAQLGFEVHPDTASRCRALCEAGHLDTVAPERLFREFDRALSGAHASAMLAAFVQTGFARWLQGGSRQAAAATAPWCSHLASALARARQRGFDSVRRFALFAIAWSDLEALVVRLAPPRDHTRTARLGCEFADLLMAPYDAPPEQVLALIKRSGALHEDDALMRVMDVVETSRSYEHGRSRACMIQALQAARGVDPAPLARLASGAALGARLDTERGTVIEQALRAHRDAPRGSRVEDTHGARPDQANRNSKATPSANR